MVLTRQVKRLQSSSQKSQRDYDQQTYWDDRYQAQLSGNDDNDDHTNEWYFSYADISDVLKGYFKQIHRRSPVLDIGCGLSKIFDELSQDDFLGPFIGIDYSPVVINQCKKIMNKKNYSYMTVNMMQKRKPLLANNSFGLILDKATTDGILCDRSHHSTIGNMYEHVSNYLSHNGVFIIITIKTVDDTAWFEECLIPALIRGSTDRSTKFLIHFHRCMTYTDGTENGPNLFVIVKYECKSYSLRLSPNRTPSQSVTVKCY